MHVKVQKQKVYLILFEVFSGLVTSRSTQLSALMSSGDCNSQPVTYETARINHIEGGWPKVRIRYKNFLREGSQKNLIFIKPPLRIAPTPLVMDNKIKKTHFFGDSW